MAECVCNIIYDDGSDITRADHQWTYRGKAEPGVGTGETKWQIVKRFFDTDGNVVKEIYANGDPGFVHEYDERATYTYTFTGS